MTAVCGFACVFLLALLLCCAAAGAGMDRPPENVYRGELIAFPGPYAFDLPRSSIILVSDQDLEALSDPDRVVDLSLTFDKYQRSLRQICEEAQARGQRTLILAFDHFFKQYRPGQDVPRRLTPDMDEYIQRIASISRFAEGYGLGLELSLLSPLEVGPAYVKATGESGVWMHYRKGLRDPQTGDFSVQLWRQKRWANNKGPVDVQPAGVRVFAFKQSHLPGTPYLVVNPEDIVEITDEAQVEVWPTELRTADYLAERIRVHGRGKAAGDRDRVLVVQIYRTPEMDYFSPKALPYLQGLVDRYVDAGVRLNALYSDEMHIQQDWGYLSHHDNGEFALRYVSPGLQAEFARRFGAEYADFAKYLVYFCSGQEDTANDLISARVGMQHVFGATPADIHRTMLFRARYYQLLQDGVVDLFVRAKHHAERRFGYRLEARAHATWAESPPCDYWDVGQLIANRLRYEYTSDFIWSNTVHQAASACYDYFRWGDFLTGNGNDHAEGGWLDRNYLGLALACSTGVLNEVPYSYAAHWGMPWEISQRRQWLATAYGAGGSGYGLVQGMVHRDVDVLMTYPLDLVAVDERFGSWMTQYGYANLITQSKLLEMGAVKDGAIEVAGRRYTTLVTQFEPFPSRRLLQMMRELAESGGTVLWSGPPPILSLEGGDIQDVWRDLFGCEHHYGQTFGVKAPGFRVTFEGALEGVEPMTILTGLIVDRIYPVTPREGSQVAARCGNRVIGVTREVGKGKTAFLGCRLRDDQARSLGYDVATLFQSLERLGAYPRSKQAGSLPGPSDNTEVLSRTGDYLVCRFPNGAITITNHLRLLEEDWPGGFARNRQADEEYIRRNPPPPETLHMEGFLVNGHSVTFHGEQVLAFRLDGEGDLEAFAGSQFDSITIDGREWKFTDSRVPHLIFGPVPAERRVPGGAIYMVRFDGTGSLRIPAKGLPPRVRAFTEGLKPGSKGAEVSCRVEPGFLILEGVAGVTPGRWIYVTPE
ncbi:MAG: hypothetical protein ACUVSM_10610 [Armatimonadota bacterium]